MARLDAAMVAFVGLFLEDGPRVVSEGLAWVAPVGLPSGVQVALSDVFTPPLWQILLLLLGLTVGLALHLVLLHPLGSYPFLRCPPQRSRGRGGGPLTRRWPLALCVGVLFLLAAVHFAPGAALAGAVMLLSALLLLAVVDAATWRLPDAITQPLLWLGLLFNLGATFVPLSDAVWGAVSGYLTLWCVNGVYRLVRRRHGLGAGDFKLLAAMGAWRALPLLLLLAATGGLLCVLCLRRWRDAGDAAGVWSLARAGGRAAAFLPRGLT